MKKFGEILLKILIAILFVVVVIPFLAIYFIASPICNLIATPIKKSKYKKSSFYKDFGIKFSDVVYQSYADAYNRQGQSAAKKTLNNLNASTMGRGSSYGAAATAQVQQAYAQKLSEMIPQLAQQEYDRLVQNYNMERDIADSVYNRQLNAYDTVTNQESRDIENDILKYNRGATKLQYEYLPQQLKNDIESGSLANEISRLQIENLGYENRISAIAALIQETYGMRLAYAEAVAAELENGLGRH